MLSICPLPKSTGKRPHSVHTTADDLEYLLSNWLDFLFAFALARSMDSQSVCMVCYSPISLFLPHQVWKLCKGHIYRDLSVISKTSEHPLTLVLVFWWLVCVVLLDLWQQHTTITSLLTMMYPRALLRIARMNTASCWSDAWSIIKFLIMKAPTPVVYWKVHKATEASINV